MSAAADNPDTDAQVLRATRRWLERVVIGLDLCPFAQRVLLRDQVAFVISAAQDEDALEADLAAALQRLMASDSDTLDTLLLVHPQVLQHFYDYNAFLTRADALLVALELEGVIQIASFHPHYEFGDAAPDAVENFSNRSPYPMLHLLRESSVERAIAAYGDTSRIVERNIARLRALGPGGVRDLLD